MAISPPADRPPWRPDEEVARQPDRLPGLSLTVSQADGDWSDGDALAAAIHRLAVALSRHPAGIGTQGREATVVLGSDQLLRRLNATYRGKDVPTNVLSFPLAELDELTATVAGPELLLGDIILARGVCAAEAADKGVTVEQHAMHLLVHGTLHLLGYDHQDDATAADMEAREIRALSRLGLANPYEGQD